MNNIAIIFQRSSVGSPQERQQEAARLSDSADRKGWQVVSIYEASGEPNILTIDMLINHCIAREKPEHVLLTALSRLWIGDDMPEIIAMVEAAGAIVHVVPPEAP
jgi:hypothetical protein